MDLPIRKLKEQEILSTHDLYGAWGHDAPESIRDRNGEVELGQCRRCGRGEVQLLEGICEGAHK